MSYTDETSMDTYVKMMGKVKKWKDDGGIITEKYTDRMTRLFAYVEEHINEGLGRIDHLTLVTTNKNSTVVPSQPSSFINRSIGDVFANFMLKKPSREITFKIDYEFNLSLSGIDTFDADMETLVNKITKNPEKIASMKEHCQRTKSIIQLGEKFEEKWHTVLTENSSSIQVFNREFMHELFELFKAISSYVKFSYKSYSLFSEKQQKQLKTLTDGIQHERPTPKINLNINFNQKSTERS